MKTRYLPLVLCALNLSLPAMAGEIEFIGIKPGSVFAKESTHVTITAKWKAPLGPEDKLFLVEVDEAGKTLKTVGEMSDTGRWGDTVKDDGYFSKQFQVYEKRGDLKRYYTVVRQVGKEVAETPADRDPALIVKSEIVSVDVIRRPNVFEIMSRIWAKITH